MKKYSLTLLLALAGCMIVPMTSFAQTSIGVGTSLAGTVAFAPSKSVDVSVNSNATAYSAAAAHMQGTEYYAALSSSTSMFVLTGRTPSLTPTALNTALATALGSSPTATGTIIDTK